MLWRKWLRRSCINLELSVLKMFKHVYIPLTGLLFVELGPKNNNKLTP